MGETEQINAVEERKPASLSEVIADLRGFGIEEFEEILTLEIGGKQVPLKSLISPPTRT
jgi:hypothetical protein